MITETIKLEQETRDNKKVVNQITTDNHELKNIED